MAQPRRRYTGYNGNYRRMRSREDLIRKRAMADWEQNEASESDNDGIFSLETLARIVVQQYDFSSGVEAGQLREAWRKAAGDFLSTHAELVSIKDGIALVRTSQPALHHHMMYSRKMIVAKLNQALPEQSIKDLKIQFG